MDLGAHEMVSKEAADLEMEEMVNRVEKEEGGALSRNKLQANSIGSRLKRVDSLDLESSRVLGMDTHGMVSINNKSHLYIIL